MPVKFKDNHNNNRNAMVDFQSNKREKNNKTSTESMKRGEKRSIVKPWLIANSKIIEVNLNDE